MKEPGGLQRVGHNWANNTHTCSTRIVKMLYVILIRESSGFQKKLVAVASGEKKA